VDITVSVDTYEVEDRSWLGSRDGTEFTRTITLDLTKFVLATHFPKGYIPSGMTLGKVTATGLYGPYDNAAADGREVAEGFLFNTTKVKTGVTKAGAPLHWRGVIRTNRLPVNNGLDVPGRADMAAKFRFE
jgi:hypothetical protein